MQDATEKTILKNTRGRPKTDSTPVMVRIHPDLLTRLDLYIRATNAEQTRPEAIRALLDEVLADKGIA